MTIAMYTNILEIIIHFFCKLLFQPSKYIPKKDLFMQTHIIPLLLSFSKGKIQICIHNPHRSQADIHKRIFFSVPSNSFSNLIISLCFIASTAHVGMKVQHKTIQYPPRSCLNQFKGECFLPFYSCSSSLNSYFLAKFRGG